LPSAPFAILAIAFAAATARSIVPAMVVGVLPLSQTAKSSAASPTRKVWTTRDMKGSSPVSPPSLARPPAIQ
jgi:hypothetical protein